MKLSSPILLLAGFAQLIFGLVVFPAATTTRDSDVFWQIQNEEQRNLAIQYHRRNQSIAKNAFWAFSATTIVFSLAGMLVEKKK